MKSRQLKGSLDVENLFRTIKYKRDFKANNPTYFDPEGLLIFCGPQGSGKTLSAVQYCKKVLSKYPKCKFVTNVQISGLPPEIEVLPYEGIVSLSDIQNGMEGVLYLIDEIHLEWNSLESKDISIEEMTEFAQQRKQRKHIVGTSQVFMRLAKPLREQIKRVVVCENFFGLVQHNIEIDGTAATEKDGRLNAQVKGNYYWFHTPELYGSYDTFAKMQRYTKEWKARQGKPAPMPYADTTPGVLKHGFGGGIRTV